MQLYHESEFQAAGYSATSASGKALWSVYSDMCANPVKDPVKNPGYVT